MSMTLEQLRETKAHTIDAVTDLVRGATKLILEAEVYGARGGADAVAALLAANPEEADEINEFADLVADVGPIVLMLEAGLMLEGSAERATLMERRGDA